MFLHRSRIWLTFSCWVVYTRRTPEVKMFSKMTRQTAAVGGSGDGWRYRLQTLSTRRSPRRREHARFTFEWASKSKSAVAAFLTASPAAARAECATNAILACFWCVILVCAVGTSAAACKAVHFSTSYEKKVGESGHCCPSIAAPLHFQGGKVSLFKRRVEIDRGGQRDWHLSRGGFILSPASLLRHPILPPL